jgi:Fic family protein
MGARRFRHPCKYDAFIPDRLVGGRFNLAVDTAADFDDAASALNDLQRHDANLLRPLTHLMMRTESIASSRIEEVSVDARGLARAEARQRIGRSVGSQAKEVIGNIEAMQFAIDRAVSVPQVGLTELLEVHRRLMRGRPESAGRCRSSQNWIGGNDHNPCRADYVPPPPEDVNELIDDLIEFCNSRDYPVLFQAAVAHAQFETIHPFEDGNGRTGRALIHIVMRRRGYANRIVLPISAAFSRNRRAYVGGLVAFRSGDVQEWLATFADAVLQSLNIAARYVGLVTELLNRWREQLRYHANPRSDAAAWQILAELPAYPVFNRADAIALCDRSARAIDHGLRQLEAAGVLEPLHGESSGRRSWEPQGLLDLIVDLEAGEVASRD